MRRAAVTGIGVVAPGGTGRHRFWETITTGRVTTRRITFFDASGLRSQIAAECDFEPHTAGLNEQEIRRTDRYVQLGLAAALEAMKDSALDLDREDRQRVGVVMGTGLGGTMYLEEDYVAASNRGREWLVDPEYTSPFLYQALLPSSLTSEVGIKFGAHGPSVTVSSGYNAGIDAIGYGKEIIETGEADVVIVGAAEAAISPLTMAGFDTIKATSQRNDDPRRACRPFDRDRDGFVLGEGAAVLILEELEGALARGAHVYCEVAGFASRATAHHMTGLTAEGLELADAIVDAMSQAGVRPEAVDYISAHGTGAKQSDRHETAAYRRALGDRAYAIPISSIKSTIGHALGASGALQAAACALVIEHGVIPPTANWENREPECDLDYTPKAAKRTAVNVTLSVGSSFGGFQSAMVILRAGES